MLQLRSQPDEVACTAVPTDGLDLTDDAESVDQVQQLGFESIDRRPVFLVFEERDELVGEWIVELLDEAAIGRRVDAQPMGALVLGSLVEQEQRPLVRIAAAVEVPNVSSHAKQQAGRTGSDHTGGRCRNLFPLLESTDP